jgi:hypothetical protein
MKSVEELIGELRMLQDQGVEYIEFVDTEWNNYDFKSVEQSGANDFGYMFLTSDMPEDYE